MKIPALSPVGLRQILAASLFLTGVAGAGLFYIAASGLSKVAVEVSKTTTDARTSQNNIQVLQQLSKSLESKQTSIERATKVRADSTAYNYQGQIVNDLNVYANRAQVKIKNIDFAATTKVSGSAPAATSVGPKTVPVAIALDSPVDYRHLLDFMNSIEQSLTKMQLSSITLTKATDGNGVSTDILNLAVYVQGGAK